MYHSAPQFLAGCRFIPGNSWGRDRIIVESMKLGVAGQGWSTLEIIFGKRFWDSYTLKNYTYGVYFIFFFKPISGVVLLALLLLRVANNLSYWLVGEEISEETTEEFREEITELSLVLIEFTGQFSSSAQRMRDMDCSGVWGLQDSCKPRLDRGAVLD